MSSESDRQRAAIKDFMASRNLKPRPWCEKAKVAEGTLRAFLKGATRSLTTDTLAKLAQAENVTISEILGEASNTNNVSPSPSRQAVAADIAKEAELEDQITRLYAGLQVETWQVEHGKLPDDIKEAIKNRLTQRIKEDKATIGQQQDDIYQALIKGYVSEYELGRVR